MPTSFKHFMCFPYAIHVEGCDVTLPLVNHRWPQHEYRFVVLRSKVLQGTWYIFYIFIYICIYVYCYMFQRNHEFQRIQIILDKEHVSRGAIVMDYISFDLISLEHKSGLLSSTENLSNSKHATQTLKVLGAQESDWHIDSDWSYRSIWAYMLIVYRVWHDDEEEVRPYVFFFSAKAAGTFTRRKSQVRETQLWRERKRRFTWMTREDPAGVQPSKCMHQTCR